MPPMQVKTLGNATQNIPTKIPYELSYWPIEQYHMQMLQLKHVVGCTQYIQQPVPVAATRFCRPSVD